MEGDLRMRFARRLECAVQIVDDFTGKPISGSGVTVWAPDLLGAKAIRKSEGFFLFMKNNAPLKRIIAEGPGYTEECVEINPESLDRLRPVVKIRLRPGRTYAFPKDITGISGIAEPKSVIELYCKNGDMNMSPVLLRDYDSKGDIINLFCSDKESLDGKSFVIFAKGEEDLEVMTVLEAVEDGEEGMFRLTKKLIKDYKKASAKILPLYKSTADKLGNYILPIKTACGESSQCKLSVDGGAWQEIEIETGKFTVKDL